MILDDSPSGEYHQYYTCMNHMMFSDNSPRQPDIPGQSSASLAEADNDSPSGEYQYYMNHMMFSDNSPRQPDIPGQSSASLAAADNDSKPSIQWIFFKPLTKELWLATLCFLFFTGFVFWMIERSINPVFQESSLAQFSTALYFVFSTLTSSHGQILRSPLSKIVLVVWCLTVLVLVQSYVANLSSMLVAQTSANNGSSSAAGTAPLTLRSFSGLFVVTGCVSALMLLISLTRSAYAAYTSRVRGSESQSTLQNDEENGSVVVHEQPVQEARDNDSQGAHESSAISPDEEDGGVIQDSMSNASEPAPAPAPDVIVQIEKASVQIEMTSTSNGVGGAL